MITGIDHVVIAVADLDAAMETYRQLGFAAASGGRHDQCTENALIGFADGSYIELLSFYEPCEDHPWQRLAEAGGLIDFCLATDDIEADYAALRRAGVEMSPLQRMSRLRPDGYRVEWINNKVLGSRQGLIPFIIEDITPREERLPRETAHANGATGIHSLRLAAYDAARHAAVMSAAAGVESHPVTDEALGAHGLSLEFGGHRLEYLSPKHGAGELAAHLAANRAATYAVSFKTTGERRVYSPGETMGARIALAG